MISEIYKQCMYIGNYFNTKINVDGYYDSWEGTEECGAYAKVVYDLIKQLGCDYEVACLVVIDIIKETEYLDVKDHDGYDEYTRGFLAGEILGEPSVHNLKKAEKAERLWQADDGDNYGYYQEVLYDICNDYWSTNVNSCIDVIKEINKAIKAGTNIDDVEDYLDDLCRLDKISVRECVELMEYAKEEIENV